MDWFHTLIGQSSSTIEWWQMTVRALIVFVVAVTYVRVGGTRIFGKHTVLDIILGVVLGSNFSRTLTGNAPFIPTIVASGVLVAVHYCLARLSRHSDPISFLTKGSTTQLVRDGEFLTEEMRKAGVARGDIAEAMRSSGSEPDFGKIKDAFLERSGAITIILHQD